MIDKENWCIKITRENADCVKSFLKGTEHMPYSYGAYYGHWDGKNYGTSRSNPAPVITFEEFKEHILNERKEIVYEIY